MAQYGVAASQVGKVQYLMRKMKQHYDVAPSDAILIGDLFADIKACFGFNYDPADLDAILRVMKTYYDAIDHRVAAASTVPDVPIMCRTPSVAVVPRATSAADVTRTRSEIAFDEYYRAMRNNYGQVVQPDEQPDGQIDGMSRTSSDAYHTDYMNQMLDDVIAEEEKDIAQMLVEQSAMARAPTAIPNGQIDRICRTASISFDEYTDKMRDIYIGLNKQIDDLPRTASAVPTVATVPDVLVQIEGEFFGHFTGQFSGQFVGQLDGHFYGQIDPNNFGEFTGPLDGEYSGQFKGDFYGYLNGQASGQFDGRFF
jgi:histidinol phosphatase-like enzyme